MLKSINTHNKSFHVDWIFLILVISLLALGILMVASASMVISEQQYHQPFHYLIRQLLFLVLGVVGILVVIRLPMFVWQKLSVPLMLISLVLLVAVLIPHIGHSVNGSRRWIGFGPLSLQVSELVKMAVVLYIAGYLVRRVEQVRTSLSGFIKPIVVYGIVAILLLLEPDFGATAVIGCTLLAMLYLSGARLSIFTPFLLLVLTMFVLLVLLAPYRLQRLTSFVNPWSEPYGSGYQLTQSLIAFGRGGLFGVGLGNSIQKLFYLPEAHTDFLFAVLAEELGLVAVLTVIATYMLLIWRILMFGRTAQRYAKRFNAYVCYGFAVWLGMQVFVNIGVNAGMLPTKGLTLPFISYGGSSLLVDCIVVGILLRIDIENCTRLKVR